MPVDTLNYDPFFSDVVLLLNLDVATQFVDQSDTSKTVNKYGQTAITTAIPDPFGGNGGVATLDGSTDYIGVPNDVDFRFGSGDFTMELWIRPTDLSNLHMLLTLYHEYTNRRSFQTYLNQSGIAFAWTSVGSTLEYLQGGGTVTLNEWHHLAFVRKGRKFSVFVNGVEKTSRIMPEGYSLYANTVDPFGIGYKPSFLSSHEFQGQLSNVRVTKGVARYTSTFIPRQSAFPSVGPQPAPFPPFIANPCHVHDGTLFHHGEHPHDALLTHAALPEGEPAPFPTLIIDPCHVHDGTLWHDGEHPHDAFIVHPLPPTGTPAGIPAPIIDPCHVHDGTLWHDGEHPHNATCVHGEPAPFPAFIANPCPTYRGLLFHNGAQWHKQGGSLCDPPPDVDPDAAGLVLIPPPPDYLQMTREALHLLPPNATAQEKALSLAVARAGAVPSNIRPLWDAQSCPRHLLSWLAWGLSVAVWDDAWSENRKREVIAQTISVHQHKGTPGAVRDALVSMGYADAQVLEQTDDLPAFQFDIEVGLSGQATQNDITVIRQRVDMFKNTRSQCRNIAIFSLHHNGLAVRDGSFTYAGVPLYG